MLDKGDFVQSNTSSGEPSAGRNFRKNNISKHSSIPYQGGKELPSDIDVNKTVRKTSNLDNKWLSNMKEQNFEEVSERAKNVVGNVLRTIPTVDADGKPDYATWRQRNQEQARKAAQDAATVALNFLNK